MGSERRIQNVAAGQIGASSTDAINGSQLYATNSAIAAGATHYYSVNSVDQTAGSNYANDGATAANALAAGVGASASAQFATALGANTVASVAGGVALGSGSVASTAGGAIGYAPAGSSVAQVAAINATNSTTLGAVSVGTGAVGGNRQITNVAAGTNAGDAVNVSQLQAVSSAVSAIDFPIRSGNTGPFVTNAKGVDSLAVGATASTFGTQNTVVGERVTAGSVAGSVQRSTVVGSNLQAAGSDQIVIGVGSATQAKGRSVLIGNNTNAIDATDVVLGSLISSPGSVAVGNDAFVTGVSTAVGNDSAADNRSVAIGQGTSAVNRATAIGFEANAGVLGTAVGSNSSATASGGVALGAGSVASIAGGAIGYTPVGSSAAQVTAINATNSTTLGAVSVGTGAIGGNRQIVNVAAGTTDSDAVNVSQLKAVSSAAAAGATHYYSVNDNGVQGGNYANDGATGVNSLAAGVGALASSGQATALGNGASASVAGGVALGSASVSDRALVPSTGILAAGNFMVPYNTTDRTLLGAVSVGNATSYRQITNVADGTQSQDAVTVRQLTGALQSFAVTPTKYFHANSAAADSLAVGNESVAVGPQTVVNGNNAIGIGNGATVQVSAPGSIAIGQGAKTQLADSIAMGTNASAAGVQGVALGAGSIVNTTGGVALGAGSVANTAAGAKGYVPTGASVAQTAAVNATTSTLAGVSVGNAATGQLRQINGVAAGSVDSDAVNVSQLKAVQTSVTTLDNNAVKYDTTTAGTTNYNSVNLGNSNSTGPVTLGNVANGVAPNDAVNVQQLNAGVASANAYTDARVNGLQGNIDGVARKAYAGVASAMALESAPYIAGKTTYAAGMGYYQSQGAVGIALGRTADNGRWSVTGGVSASAGGVAVRAGVSGIWD